MLCFYSSCPSPLRHVPNHLAVPGGSSATLVDHSGDSPLSGASSVRVRDGSLQPLAQR